MKSLYSIFYILYSKKKGQSLIELLLGIAVGVIMVIGAIAVIVPSLKSNTDAGRVQAATALAKELLENVRAWSEGDWHNIANLNAGSANHYYVNAASSPFVSVAGDQSISLGGIAYTRYFYVDAVGRAGGKILSSGGVNDPSTKKVTASVSWAGGGPTTLVSYLTRSRNNVLRQTDWSGGGGQDGPITSMNNKFSSAQSVDFISTPGSIVIQF